VLHPLFGTGWSGVYSFKDVIEALRDVREGRGARVRQVEKAPLPPLLLLLLPLLILSLLFFTCCSIDFPLSFYRSNKSRQPTYLNPPFFSLPPSLPPSLPLSGSLIVLRNSSFPFLLSFLLSFLLPFPLSFLRPDDDEPLAL